MAKRKTTSQELESEYTSESTPVKEAWEDYVGSDPNSLKYPKRLIEVDLPIARISAHSRREKSIRHGHISTLHIWWARRPLAACRAVICASLWPDPADPLCPPAFREAAVKHIKAFAHRAASGSLPDDQRPKMNDEQAELERGLSPESRGRWEAIAKGTLTLDPTEPADMGILQLCLLDFIADFANWDNSNVPAYLETSCALTSAAHESLGGIPGSKPLVIDPFAGGGSIPLESLRVGADAFASDLNPVAALLNKVVLEYVPKYGHELAEEVRRWGTQIKADAIKSIGKFYPLDEDGSVPIAYLWARTVLSDAPGESEPPVEVPIFRSMSLAKGKYALRWKRNKSGGVETETVTATYSDGEAREVRRPVVEVFEPKSESEVEDGTVNRGSVTCPVTGYTTPVANVRTQLKTRFGGTRDARLLAVVLANTGKGKKYRVAEGKDFDIAENCARQLELDSESCDTTLPLIPNEVISLNEIRRISLPIYGMTEWGHAFSSRQCLVLSTLGKLVRDAPIQGDPQFVKAIRSVLALAVGRQADYCSSCVTWVSGGEFVRNTFARQALAMVWDFAETNPFTQT